VFERIFDRGQHMAGHIARWACHANRAGLRGQESILGIARSRGAGRDRFDHPSWRTRAPTGRGAGCRQGQPQEARKRVAAGFERLRALRAGILLDGNLKVIAGEGAD